MAGKRPEATEKPTGKRLSEARSKGSIARSQDLAPSIIFLTVIIALHIGFHSTLNSVAEAFAHSLIHVTDKEQQLGVRDAIGLFIQAGAPFGPLVAFTFASALVVGIAANLYQTRFYFNFNMLMPKFGKLNPIAGLSNVFVSKQTLVNLAKQLLKLGTVAYLIYYVLHDKVMLFYSLAHAAPRDIAFTIEGLLYEVGIRFGIILVLLAIADYIWQKRQYTEGLKMTKSEVKDEAKQSEGSPEAKGEQRKRRFAARKRMLAMVPKATVVVTNPTHFACALLWDEVTMDAPILVAKGADLLARRIKQVAIENGVPIMENAPLARSIYNTVPLDSPIPPDLYAAVAQVIAFVYKLKKKTIA